MLSYDVAHCVHSCTHASVLFFPEYTDRVIPRHLINTSLKQGLEGQIDSLLENKAFEI